MTGRAATVPAGTHRASRRPQDRAAGAASAEATAAGLLALFLAALLLPVYFDVAGLRLTPYRILLLVAFVPLAIRWLSGAAGRVTAGDILIGLSCLWLGLALLVVHGPARIPFAGITIVEIFSSYLLGRVLIRSVIDFRLFFRYFLIALAILAPFVLVENLTGRLILNDVLSSVAPTHQKVQASAENQRLGLVRAQAVVDHPILWGVFCSIAVANVFHLYREQLAKSFLLTGFAVVMTFTSLSSGPLLAAVLQIGMTAWGWITRNAWWVLAGIALFCYVAIDILSNRTPIQVMITYLTFSPHNAYWRLHIWNFGSAEVLRHPVFGLGLNDWVRPSWMSSSSVDNFWLLTAMRYGLPTVILLFAGIVTNLVQIMRADLPDSLRDVRTGYVIATIALMLALCTVHIWGATAILIMFYLGAGNWMFTGGAAAGPATSDILTRGDCRRAPVRCETLPYGRHGGATADERLARRRAQYSGRRP